MRQVSHEQKLCTSGSQQSLCILRSVEIFTACYANNISDKSAAHNDVKLVE